MTSGLIGYTGFVGGNLVRQHTFDARYRSSNIDEIRGREFDLLVCAGAPAEKWRANQNPEEDRASLRRLSAAVRECRARTLVLISTVDVYPTPVDVDETTTIDPRGGQAYGRHRLQLEHELADAFDTVVIRLPALFGPGLKKNLIFDLLHGNQLERIHADASYQFYDLERLWSDVGLTLSAGLGLVNLATEPVTARELGRVAFGSTVETAPAGDVPRYDVRTAHAAVFGGTHGYILDRPAVLRGLTDFVTTARDSLRAVKSRADDPPPPVGRLAISNIAWDRGEDVLARQTLYTLGVQGVEIAPTKIWDEPLSVSAADVERYRDFWGARGIAIVALQSLLFSRDDLRIFDLPAVRDRTRDYLIGMVRLGARLGARTLVFGSPRQRSLGGTSPAEAARLAVPFFRAIGEIAEQEGVVFCIEPNPAAYGCDYLTRVSEVLEILDAAASPGLGLHVDTAALVLQGEALPDVLDAALPRVRHVHVSEPYLAPIGSDGTPHILLAGSLAQGGYAGWISIEMKAAESADRGADLAAAIRTTRRLYHSWLASAAAVL